MTTLIIGNGSPQVRALRAKHPDHQVIGRHGAVIHHDGRYTNVIVAPKTDDQEPDKHADK